MISCGGLEGLEGLSPQIQERDLSARTETPKTT